MNLPIVISIGALFGGLSGASIFFEPGEPYKWQNLCAATLKDVLIALLTGFSIAATTRWWSAMAIGALSGFAFGLVIYLAKGGPKSGEGSYVIPTGIVTAGLTGLFIVMWPIKTKMMKACLPVLAILFGQSFGGADTAAKRSKKNFRETFSGDSVT